MPRKKIVLGISLQGEKLYPSPFCTGIVLFLSLAKGCQRSTVCFLGKTPIFFSLYCWPFCWKIVTAIFLKEIISAVLVFGFYRKLQKLSLHLQKSRFTTYPRCPTNWARFDSICTKFWPLCLKNETSCCKTCCFSKNQDSTVWFTVCYKKPIRFLTNFLSKYQN